MHGIVVKSTGSWYTVEAENGEIIPCKIKGTFRLKENDSTNPVVVGDRVELDPLEDKSGIIHTIAPRKNYIIRKSKKLSKQSQMLAANIDRAFLIATIALPRTSTGFIDRFLVTAEAYSIPATLIFNKSDIYQDDELEYQQQLAEMYAVLGYDSLLVSAFNPNDIALLESRLEKGINLFSGHSGVGKSTLLNALHPALDLRTEEISEQHQTGQHTTTFAEMHKLKSGVYVIDTPGIRDFGMYDFEKESVSHYFPEMRALMNQCKFDNCIHINEPGCVVKKAVDESGIALTRYNNYLSIVSGDDNYN